MPTVCNFAKSFVHLVKYNSLKGMQYDVSQIWSYFKIFIFKTRFTELFLTLLLKKFISYLPQKVSISDLLSHFFNLFMNLNVLMNYSIRHFKMKLSMSIFFNWICFIPSFLFFVTWICIWEFYHWIKIFMWWFSRGWIMAKHRSSHKYHHKHKACPSMVTHV